MSASLNYRSCWLIPGALALLLSVGACSDDSGTTPTPDMGADIAVDMPGGDGPAVDMPAVDATPPVPDTVLPDASSQPITATDKTWTWVDFPDARCANDSPTGIGVNLNSASTKVLIFMAGGGACWSTATCKTFQLAVNLDGYDKTKFDADKAVTQPAVGVFDRNDSNNPYADWNLVYVPYCTGDVHSGSGYSPLTGQHHVGHRNIARYLSRLVPTFSGATQVVLSGSSAGGVGTFLNYEQVQTAFGTVPVHVLNDSGAAMEETYLKPALQTQWENAWGLSKNFPSGCTNCTVGNIDAIYGYLSTTYTDRRFALISSRGDKTLRQFYGFGNSPPKDLTADEWKKGLDELADDKLSKLSNWKVFFIDGDGHVFLTPSGLGTTVGTTKLSDWITAFNDDTAGWVDTRP